MGYTVGNSLSDLSPIQPVTLTRDRTDGALVGRTLYREPLLPARNGGHTEDSELETSAADRRRLGPREVGLQLAPVAVLPRQ